MCSEWYLGVVLLNILFGPHQFLWEHYGKVRTGTSYKRIILRPSYGKISDQSSDFEYYLQPQRASARIWINKGVSTYDEVIFIRNLYEFIGSCGVQQ